MKKIYILPILIFLIAAVASCKKGPGPGGQSKIAGKIFARNLNKTFDIIRDSGYVADEKVFISYGDNSSVGDNVTSSFDGSFLFEYLRPGNYKIWCLSKQLYGINKLDTSIVKNITITSNGEVVNAGDIVIYTNKN